MSCNFSGHPDRGSPIAFVAHSEHQALWSWRNQGKRTETDWPSTVVVGYTGILCFNKTLLGYTKHSLYQRLIIVQVYLNIPDGIGGTQTVCCIKGLLQRSLHVCFHTPRVIAYPTARLLLVRTLWPFPVFICSPVHQEHIRASEIFVLLLIGVDVAYGTA